MKTITKEYKVFEFNELSDEAKNKVISDWISSTLESEPYNLMPPNWKKAIDKAESMQTPWFTTSYVYDYCKEDIIENIIDCEYTFLEDGTMFKG